MIDARVSRLATDPLEVAVVIGQERLAARISPATARGAWPRF
ncbi:MAG: hypothetical protein U1F17_15805 [Burkholderiaceae bacterium]